MSTFITPKTSKILTAPHYRAKIVGLVIGFVHLSVCQQANIKIFFKRMIY